MWPGGHCALFTAGMRAVAGIARPSKMLSAMVVKIAWR
jgi:hypothetical protein